jgi:hypothetical protein
MTFKLVYISNKTRSETRYPWLRRPKRYDWLCTATSVAIILSGHGYSETPKSLGKTQNPMALPARDPLGAVSQICRNVTLSHSFHVPPTTPLTQIDASIAAGQPVIVMVDNSPAAGLQTHWVVLYAKEGNDYLMLDPWPISQISQKKIC